MPTLPTLHLSASTGFTRESDTTANWAGARDGLAFGVAAGGRAPTLVADAINGHSALRFSGTQAMAGAVSLGAKVGTVMMLVSQTNRQRNKVPWSVGGTYVHTPYSDRSSVNSFSDNSYVNWRTGNRSACGVQYGETHLLTWVEDGQSCKLYNNGELKVTYGGGRPPAWGKQTMVVGNYRGVSPGHSIEGLLAEVLVFDTALGDEERSATEIGLMRKYALGGHAMPAVQIHKIVEVKERVFTNAGSSVINDERAELVNTGQVAVDLSGWTLDAGDRGQSFEFPEGATLEPGASASVWTHRDEARAIDNQFSFSRSSSIWNNKGDVGTLSDAEGNEVSRVAYGDQA